MRKIMFMVAFLSFIGMQAFAQTTVTGTVTDANGEPVPGANVRAKGFSDVGTITDLNGSYSLSVPDEATTLIFSFVGMKTQEVQITGDVVNAALESEDQVIDDVIVTALGVTRDKKSLGYSVQEVDGAEVNTAKDASFISSLSGKVAGVNIKKQGQIGGSVDIIIRGANSFTGNNQALFVVDGVPLSNDNTNTSSNNRNGGGYDYGNAASDIDPESIESISVLKGATAAALYGSDAANGVVLITTKKGSAKKGLGVTFNQAVTFSKYDTMSFS